MNERGIEGSGARSSVREVSVSSISMVPIACLPVGGGKKTDFVV